MPQVLQTHMLARQGSGLMKDVERTGIEGPEVVMVMAKPKTHAASATAPAAKMAEPVAKRRRIDPVGKFLLENRGALGAGHKLDL